VCTLHPFLKLRNFGGKAYTLYARAVEAARAAGDEFGESIALQGLAGACKEHRTMTEAIEHLTRALVLMRLAGDADREAHQTVDLGNLMFRAERMAEARDLYVAADRLLAESDDTRLRSAVVNNLGVVCRELGEFDQAIDYFRRALGMPGHSLRDGLITEVALAIALEMKGDLRAALAAFEQVLNESAKDRFRYGEVTALAGLSSVHRKLGDLTAAVDHGRRALRSAREHGLRDSECDALSCLGEAFFLSGDLERAERVFAEVEELGERYQLVRFTARSLEGQAHLWQLRGDVAADRRCWEQAIERYPVGLVHIEYARTHLASLDRGRTTCFRCEMNEPSRGVSLLSERR
jgi:tetratricopeptide (TPR) repeat protein